MTGPGSPAAQRRIQPGVPRERDAVRGRFDAGGDETAFEPFVMHHRHLVRMESLASVLKRFLGVGKPGRTAKLIRTQLPVRAGRGVVVGILHPMDRLQGFPAIRRVQRSCDRDHQQAQKGSPDPMNRTKSIAQSPVGRLVFTTACDRVHTTAVEQRTPINSDFWVPSQPKSPSRSQPIPSQPTRNDKN